VGSNPTFSETPTYTMDKRIHEKKIDTRTKNIEIII